MVGEGSCEIGTPPREGISKDLGKILQFPRVSHKGFLQKHYQSGQITTTLRKPELTAIKLGGDSLTSDQPEDKDSSNLGIFLGQDLGCMFVEKMPYFLSFINLKG